ncbi:hypothetical protein V8V50_07160 [Ligilactobacillus salivarius]
MNEIELAHVNDVDRCLEIIDSGKKFQNDQDLLNGQTTILIVKVY